MHYDILSYTLTLYNFFIKIQNIFINQDSFSQLIFRLLSLKFDSIAPFSLNTLSKMATDSLARKPDDYLNLFLDRKSLILIYLSNTNATGI